MSENEILVCKKCGAELMDTTFDVVDVLPPYCMKCGACMDYFCPECYSTYDGGGEPFEKHVCVSDESTEADDRGN